MKIVWDKSPRTAREIIDLLIPVKGWKPKTIKSLISRLVNKEALGFHKVGKIYSYYPRACAFYPPYYPPGAGHRHQSFFNLPYR